MASSTVVTGSWANAKSSRTTGLCRFARSSRQVLSVPPLAKQLEHQAAKMQVVRTGLQDCALRSSAGDAWERESADRLTSGRFTAALRQLRCRHACRVHGSTMRR